MEAALNIFYMAMAVYGWWHWQRDDQSLRVKRWDKVQHIKAMLLVLALSLFSGGMLDANTTAALPYLDSFTTWASVIATFMVANKILENWLYWIVIDAVSIYLYLDRGLQITALLFVFYVGLAILGYFQWVKTYKSSSAS